MKNILDDIDNQCQNDKLEKKKVLVKHQMGRKIRVLIAESVMEEHKYEVAAITERQMLKILLEYKRCRCFFGK